MHIRKKKTSPEKEKSTEENLSEKEEIANLITRLFNPAEVAYHILVKWTETNLLLERIAKAEEERNQIAEEEYFEDEED